MKRSSPIVLILTIIFSFAGSLAPMAAGAAISSVVVGSAPRMLAVDETLGLVFASNYSSSSVSVISTSTHQVQATINVGAGPHGMAVDSIAGLLYVANNLSNSVSVVVESTMTGVATLAVGAGPWGIAVDKLLHRAYVTCSNSNQLYVIDGNSLSVITAISIGGSPNNVAVDEATHTVYTADYWSNSVSVIDGATITSLRTISVKAPSGVSINPSTHEIYVSSEDRHVYVFNTADESSVAVIEVGSYSQSLIVDVTSNRVFVPNLGSNTVSIIDGSRKQVVSTLSVGSEPHGLVFDSATQDLYIAFMGGNQISYVNVSSGIDSNASFEDWVKWTTGNPGGLPLGGSIVTEGRVTTLTGGPAIGLSSPNLYDFTYGGTLAYSSSLQGQDWLAVQLSSVPGLTGVSSGSQTALAFFLDAFGNSDTFNYFTQQRCRGDQFPPAKMVLWGSDDVCQPSISTRITGYGTHNVLFKFDPVGASNPLVEVIVDGSSLGTAPLPNAWKSNPVRSPQFWTFGGPATVSNLLITTGSTPSVPQVAGATSTGDGELTWTWSVANAGGLPISNYSWSGACSGSGNVTTVTCGGLTGGESYSLYVTASNFKGESPVGTAVGTALTSPGAPTVEVPSRPASGQLTWTWSPNATGGSVITSYAWSGACSGSGLVTTVTCSGLTGGTNYSLSVTATNAVGSSSAGSSSLGATSIPATPTVNAPTSNSSGQLTWVWSPNSSGGSAITSYSWSGACSGSGNVTTVTCSGLTGGTSYTLSVTATNAVGTSGSGSRSGTALTYPGAPTANASPANGALSVTWTAPTSNGGAAITGYTATATATGSSYSCTSTTLSCTITGLTNGTTYSVSVVATNSKGFSTPSNTVSIYPAPDTKFLAYSPNSVVLVKSNFQVLVANAKAGALVTVTAAGATKTCTANAVGECSVTLNSTKSSGWVIVASYVDGKKTVSTLGSYRVNIVNVTVSSIQIAKGKSFTVKIASGAPGTKFQVVASSGTTYSVTLTSSGAGTITVATKAKGPLTLSISDNGILLQTITVAVV